MLALSMLGGIAPAALALDADGGSPETVVSDSGDPGAAGEGGVQIQDDALTPDDALTLDDALMQDGVQTQEGDSETEETSPALDGAPETIPEEPTEETPVEAPEDVPSETPEDEPEPAALESAPAGMTLYVASSGKGGSAANPGTEAAPLLRISDAIGKAADEGAAALTVILKSNIEISQELVFDGGDADFPITVTSASGQYRIQYAGTNPIGGKSGVFRVTNGAEVTFENVRLAGSTGTYDGRVLYVAENAVAGLSESTADVRMAQYEMGYRTPKRALLGRFADALGVSVDALAIPVQDMHYEVRERSVALVIKTGNARTMTAISKTLAAF